MTTALKPEDEQILTEIVLNEKLVVHPTKGTIRFRIPTLEIQRKVDALSRAKKKVLREAVDHIPDESAPNGYRIVPAYKSREVLAREYKELGWWTDENEARLTDLIRVYSGNLAKLELLGFESETEIYNGLSDLKEEIIKLLDNPSDEVKAALIRSTMVGAEPAYADKTLIKDAATSTTVDDLLSQVDILQSQFLSYIELGKSYGELIRLEAEKSSLFGDSWQEQLQYFIKLAQLFYCTEKLDVNPPQPLWKSVEELEKERDVEFVRWLFSELQAFWQGLSDEARGRLNKYSFMPRLSVEKSLSEESPAPAQKLPDGDSSESQQNPSSEVTAIPAPSPSLS